VNFDAVPLKCSSGIHVQATEMIDILIRELSSADSEIKQAYMFAKEVASETFTSFGNKKWFGDIAGTEKRMGNKVEVDEMAEKARSVLPWDGFIRPSQQYTWGMNFKWGPHVSAPDNLFFVCFGPRVSSFPHKRDKGGHFLADMNMAGCNGLWDIKDVAKHVARIRKLFAPETCLTENMKQKLRTVFLDTFVDMNKNFEKKLIGKFFSQRQDGMETIPDELLPKSLMPIAEKDLQGRNLADDASLVRTKYQRVGRLVAGAHTKWIVCDARNPESPAQGIAGSFFNSAKAYKDWFQAGTLSESKTPECKTYDQSTGCMRCVIAVRTHPWRCLTRLGLSPQQVMEAIETQTDPLPSSYDAVKIEETEDGQTKETLVKKRGVCLVGKDVTNHGRLTEADKFRRVAPTDKIFQVERSDVKENGFILRDRYNVQERRNVLATYIRDNGGVGPKVSGNGGAGSVEEKRRIMLLKMVAGRETHYPEDRFGPLLTYSDVIPESSNVAAHEVDYFVTCPCEADDFSSMQDYQSASTKRMQDYGLA